MIVRVMQFIKAAGVVWLWCPPPPRIPLGGEEDDTVSRNLSGWLNQPSAIYPSCIYEAVRFYKEGNLYSIDAGVPRMGPVERGS